ncbi:MAG TPA: Rieske 2Fe-2S domain-containing protein [Acidimicrobiales bacterium]|nr:Rieske 2Fe-2S domain-containing protein [Acidimicrobiales bacterium]
MTGSDADDPEAPRGCLGCSGDGPPPPATGPADGPGADPHAARRAEVAVATGFLASTAGAIGLAVVYWRGGQPQLEGLFLALALGGLGLGFVLWSRRFMPHQPVVEARHPIASTEEEIDRFRDEFEQGEVILTRRKLLVRTAGLAVGALGAALLFPLRSLGPRPGKGLKETPYGRGVYLVTADNQRVRAEDVNRDGVLTVFPEVAADPEEAEEPPRPEHQADSSTLLIRPSGTPRPQRGRDGWTVDGLVAYSKLCTHVGCPVGLYQADTHLLLCPCHQSTFDVLDGARPVFGPATRPLPQLPIGLDAEGYVVAEGDFAAPPGPGFWDRDR